MGQDEEGKTHPHQEQEIIEPAVAEHHGRIFKTTGDGFLVEFPSPMEAVRCAVSVQDALASRAAREPGKLFATG